MKHTRWQVTILNKHLWNIHIYGVRDDVEVQQRPRDRPSSPKIVEYHNRTDLTT